ncbi:hypothetical protein K432DRAFT_358940 [Lepidopterella palustris CBS 459.81]|uniref:Programmed cell death protein 2 C-terminal domain-containing protein n=1 Tax=Lepidopterella palustris CBS 459.81 TaxID=1314670 RepID=A0A8E2E4W3_9PEZI|nr:hypothetical protein K432DRAFT_358940 [Lepidopterella palustris CBS 459.81]
MTSYDSDSSGNEDDYTETNVLLGYASKEPTDDTISHLGGYPTWLDGNTAPSGALARCKNCNDLLSLLLELNGDLPEHFPGHERRLYIFSCRRKTCARKEGSVRGVRGVRVAKGGQDAKKGKATEKTVSTPSASKESPKPAQNIGASLFGVQSTATSSTPASPFANPFSTASGGNIQPNPFSTYSAAVPGNPFSPPAPTASIATATAIPPQPLTSTQTNLSTLPEIFASKASIFTPSISPSSPTAPPPPYEPWPSNSLFPPPYPSYYLDADYETLSALPTPSIPSTTRMEIDEPDNNGGDGKGGNGKEDKDAFESSIDATFQRFADRLSHNPEQVLRYEFQGVPLLYSKTDGVAKLLLPQSEKEGINTKVLASGSGSGLGIPRCSNCGTERVFEVQLTPHAIVELEAEETGIEGMEWGTIVLGVCGRDCEGRGCREGEVGYLEEWVGVQWEEVAKR